MHPGTRSRQLPQWKSRLRYAYILSIDTISLHTVDNICLVISEARSANIKSVVVAFTKDDAQNSLSAIGLPQLYFNRHWITKGHIIHMVIAVVHKGITGPKFNRRTLNKQLDWKDWLAAEWVQLDNYAKQKMCGPPCITPIDAYIFFCVWLYSIKPQENDRKKVRGVCDGSTHGGQTMVHDATYAPTQEQLDVRLQITMTTLLAMCIWHADVTSAFAEAERHEQIYYMQCDHVFRYRWTGKHPEIPLPPDVVVLVLKNLKGHPEGPRLWSVRCHMVLVMIKFKNTTHASCLYHGIFNDECVLFLRMIDDVFHFLSN
jgi:hypothetical protein